MRRDGAVDPVVTSLLVLTLDPVVIPLLVLILVWAWPGAKPDAPGRPLMASFFFFRWPGAYAEAPFDTLPLFDTLTLLCIICPGAVGCCAMAGALTNAAKVPITARYLIIGELRKAKVSRRRRFRDAASMAPIVLAIGSRPGSRVEQRTDKPESTDVFWLHAPTEQRPAAQT